MLERIHGGPPGKRPLALSPPARAPAMRARDDVAFAHTYLARYSSMAHIHDWHFAVIIQFTSVATCKATMIFISAAAAVFLVSKFKEIDWVKACVVLPDEEHEHERYFLSEPPKKIVQGMVRSVCAFNFLLSRPLLER